jgi:hypothetical protein
MLLGIQQLIEDEPKKDCARSSFHISLRYMKDTFVTPTSPDKDFMLKEKQNQQKGNRDNCIDKKTPPEAIVLSCVGVTACSSMLKIEPFVAQSDLS